MYHSMTIAGLERKLPLCKLNDDLKIAAFVIFGDAELTVACARDLLEKAPEFDYIITAEAKGIPLAHEMSRQSGKKYFVARKKPKLYMTGVFEAVVNSITTEGEQKLYLDTAEAEEIKGQTTGKRNPELSSRICIWRQNTRCASEFRRRMPRRSRS